MTYIHRTIKIYVEGTDEQVANVYRRVKDFISGEYEVDIE